MLNLVRQLAGRRAGVQLCGASHFPSFGDSSFLASAPPVLKKSSDQKSLIRHNMSSVAVPPPVAAKTSGIEKSVWYSHFPF